MSNNSIWRDERIDAVGNAADSYAFGILNIGILVDVAAHGFLYKQNCWDLLGLVILSGAVAMIYRHVKHAHLIPRGRTLLFVLIGAFLGMIASGIAVLLLNRLF